MQSVSSRFELVSPCPFPTRITTTPRAPYHYSFYFVVYHQFSLWYHHHHHVVPLARISLTLSRHFSLSSSLLAGLQDYIPYPHIAAVSMFELVVLLLLGHMAGVHRSTSLMSSSLLLQQCPACLVRLTCIVFVTGGSWPYSWCLVGCCHQDLFNIARFDTIAPYDVFFLCFYEKRFSFFSEVSLS